MAWIDTTPEPTDEDRLSSLARDMGAADWAEVDNILKIHAHHPDGLEAHFALYRAVMSGTPSLRKVDRELIAVVVSGLNDCHY